MIRASCVTALWLAAASAAQASTLGIASDYNVFVFNVFAPYCCDVGGAVAANNVNLQIGAYQNFAVDQSRVVSAQPSYTPAYGLVAGMTTTAAYSNEHLIVNAGNAYEGTDSGLIQFQPGSDPNGILSHGLPSPIDFASAASSLIGTSAFLAAQASTIQATGDPGGGVDIAAAGAGTSITTITAAQLASGALHLTVGAGQTLVINVTGAAATTSYNGVFVNGSQLSGDSATAAEQILFNFSGSTFTLNETFAGSLLAPNASVIGNNNLQFLGGLVANNYSGRTEFHDLLFTGVTPMPPSNVPEPFGFALFGGGLLAILCLPGGLRRAK